jgi:hypothetical protein
MKESYQIYFILLFGIKFQGQKNYLLYDAWILDATHYKRRCVFQDKNVM